MARIAASIGPRATPLSLIGALLLVAGCGGKTTADYLPESNAAKQALEVALGAWQNGAASGQPIQSSTSKEMVVELFDGDWSSGSQLTQFQIVSEVATQDGTRQFAVKLTLAGKPEQDVTYFVSGIKSRYSIFRDKEYEQRALQM